MSFCMDHSVLTMEGLARSDAGSGCLVQVPEQCHCVLAVSVVTNDVGYLEVISPGTRVAMDMNEVGI